MVELAVRKKNEIKNAEKHAAMRYFLMKQLIDNYTRQLAPHQPEENYLMEICLRISQSARSFAINGTFLHHPVWLDV